MPSNSLENDIKNAQNNALAQTNLETLYSSAYNYYTNYEFELAYPIFAMIFAMRPTDEKIVDAFGKTALYLEDWDMAEMLFRHLSMNYEYNLDDALLHLARALKGKDSQEELEETLNMINKDKLFEGNLKYYDELKNKK